MSSTTTLYKETARRQYISTAAFQNNIFSYSTYLTPTLATRGSLVVNTSATALLCPAGRILRENGKVLRIGTHPDLVDPNNTSVSYTYLVGVFDAQSFINGYIDPNCPLFAPFNTDKSYQNDLTAEAVDASTGLTDQGPSVFTRGPITSSGTISGAIVSGAKLAVSPASTTNGSVGTPLTTSAGVGTLAVAAARIYTTKLTANSLIFVTVNNAAARGAAALLQTGANPTYFDVISTVPGDTSTFNWMVVN